MTGHTTRRLARPFTAMVLALGGCTATPVEQTAPCAHYVSCILATDAAHGEATNLTRFEPRGACWDNADIAELCTTGCARALERFGAAATLLECRP